MEKERMKTIKKNMNISSMNDKYLKIYSYKKQYDFFLFYCFGKQDIEKKENTVDKCRNGIKRSNTSVLLYIMTNKAELFT